jgi:raffinose/stachyose/melibiose transport system substrate-binding protein
MLLHVGGADLWFIPSRQRNLGETTPSSSTDPPQGGPALPTAMPPPEASSMPKIKIIPLLLTAVLAAALGACGSGDSGSDSGAAPKSLSFWISQQTPQSIKDEIAAYGTQAGIKTDVVTIPDPFETNTLTKWTAGERPDVIYWQPATKFFAQLVPQTNLQDLSDMAFVSKTKYNLAKESGAVDGKTYTATVGFPSIFGIFYNKAAFTKAGVQPPTTYQEFLDASAKLKKAGTTPMSVAGGDAWTTQVPVYTLLTDAVEGGLVSKINTGAATWKDPAVVSSLSTFKSYIDAGNTNTDFKTQTYADQQAALLSGKVAMAAQGSWIISGLAETAGVDKVDQTIGFAPWPATSGKVMWQSSNNASVMLPKTGDAGREKASRAYVDYATSTGYQNYLATAKEPSVIEGIADPNGVSKLQQSVADAYQKGAIPSVDMQSAASFGDFPTLVSELIVGKSTPDAVATTMQSEFVKNAKLIGVKGF